MKILAVGAHADDVELGCGGTLSRMRANGHQLTIFIATNSEYHSPDGALVRSAESARQEAENSATKLGANLEIWNAPVFEIQNSSGLRDRLVSVFQEELPDLCFTHWDGDTHPDHQVVNNFVTHAARRCPSVLAFASNWYLGPSSFDPRFFCDISDYLAGKLELIKLFESENIRTNSKWEKSVTEQAATYGLQCGAHYAEAFAVQKYLF